MSFYDDNDNDGLVNIIEYYFDEIGNYINTRSEHSMTPPLQIVDLGLDPTSPDSDNDLLVDGFEWYFGMDAKNRVQLKRKQRNYFLPNHRGNFFLG